jgi:hypothetical protein
MKFFFRFAILFFAFIAACSTTPTPAPTSTPIALAPTADAPATETTIAHSIFATLTARAPTATPIPPTIADTVTPPPSPVLEPTIEASPTMPFSPTLSAEVSPSITPVPTIAPPTAVPSPTPLQVTEDALRGKILFKSARSGGKYPNRFNYFVMDADGTNVTLLDYNAATALYQALLPLEGYSPDKSLLVIGEKTCYQGARCDLYLGPPEIIKNRSQGQWGPPVRAGSRADNPVWSPAGNWVAFIWNGIGTKNVYKGDPSRQNQDFKRLTNFDGHLDTKFPTYSPDGSQLAFATQQGIGHWQIWILDATAEDFTSANAHDLSNSDSDDWDALWIK